MRAIISAVVSVFAAVAALTATAPAPAVAQTVLASGEFSDDPSLRCEILEVKRVTGGALNIRWRIVNTAGGGGSGLVAGGQTKPIYYNFGWDELYFIDPAENKKYQFLTDSGGTRILQVFHGNIAAGQQRTNWAKFPAPPASSTKISITIPKFAPFDDVPISQ